MGVGVNVRCFAVTVLAPKASAVPNVFGQNIYGKCRAFCLGGQASFGGCAQRTQATAVYGAWLCEERRLGSSSVIAMFAGQFDADVAVGNLQCFPARGKWFNCSFVFAILHG